MGVCSGGGDWVTVTVGGVTVGVEAAGGGEFSGVLEGPGTGCVGPRGDVGAEGAFKS